MLATPWGRWVIGGLAALAIVALLAWARNDPGVGGREPDPPTSTTVVTDAGSGPHDTSAVITTDTITAAT